MSEFIGVKNFERFQHYKDRKPTWIKLYNDLLDDYEFCALPDASKWLAVGLWLLASRNENRIRNDLLWIGRMVHATEPVDLGPLLSAGFVYYLDDASKSLAEAERDASLEVEANREASEKSKLSIIQGGGALTRDEEINEVIRAANRGMADNPKIAAARPIDFGHGSRQDVYEWLNQGVPLDLARSIVYEKAQKYPVQRNQKQPYSMAYFTGAVMEAHAKATNGSERLSGDGRAGPQVGGGAKPSRDKYADRYETGAA